MGGAEARPTLRWAGDGAIVIEYGDVISSELARRAQSAASALEAAGLPWLVEAVPTYRSTLAVIRVGQVEPAEAMAAVAKVIDTEPAPGLASPPGASSKGGRLVEIPVVYGGEEGPDLEFVAEHAGLTVEEVIAIHTAPVYEVQMIGFMLGFPYLAGMDPRIAAPRLTTPRTVIPPGSVGIAGNQTGVYPLASPGGWRIIGRTQLVLADPTADPPCLLRAGDKVKFVQVKAGGDSR